jgi:hypothetical protein
MLFSLQNPYSRPFLLFFPSLPIFFYLFNQYPFSSLDNTLITPYMFQLLSLFVFHTLGRVNGGMQGFYYDREKFFPSNRWPPLREGGFSLFFFLSILTGVLHSPLLLRNFILEI